MTGDARSVHTTGVIVGVALASALVPLNSTMIAVALPDIAADFDISKGHTSILVTLYLVAMLVGQPLAGRLCDIIGARRLATIAVAGFGAFNLAAMVVDSFGLLVTARALQAVFASALVPSVQAMIRRGVAASDRGRAFGVQGSVLGMGAGLGPVIGGVAVAAFGWRAIFGVNLPVVLAALYVLRRRISHAPNPAARLADKSSDEAEGVFNPVFVAAYSTQALSTLAQYGLLLAIPIVFDSRGWSAAAIGLGLSCLTLGMVVTGPYGGRAGDVHGRRLPVIVGLAAGGIAIAVSAAGGDDVSSALLVVTLLVFGIGFGVASPGIQTSGIESVSDRRTGAAAGLLSGSRYVGSIASTLVLAEVVRDDGSGLTTLLVVSAASMGVATIAARRLPGLVPHRSANPA